MRKWIQEGLEAKAPSVHCLGCTSTGVGILSDLRGRDEARRGERNQDRQKEESGSHSECFAHSKGPRFVLSFLLHAYMHVDTQT